jgi:superfamily II DNA or RNA helicase
MEIKEDSLTTQSVIHTPNIIYVDLNTPKMVYSGAIKDKKGNVLGYNTANNKPDLQEVYEKQIVYSKHRNQTIVDLLSVYLANPHYKGLALIIVQRIEHGNTIKTLCENKDIPAVFLHGSSKNRLATLDQFRSGAFRVLIGSTILQEGEDVPKLELAIIAAGGSNLTNTIQRIGRALRIDPSGVKTKPIIVDFIDNEENFLLNNSIARKSYSSSIFPDSIQHLTYEQTKTFLSQPPA